jgi:hypothetical protein
MFLTTLCSGAAAWTNYLLYLEGYMLFVVVLLCQCPNAYPSQPLAILEKCGKPKTTAAVTLKIEGSIFFCYTT